MILTWADRITNYARVTGFPQSLFIGGDGRAYGTWIMGNNYRVASTYYGGYPAGYLKRVQALFPDKTNALHLFSGKVDTQTFPGKTVDVNAANTPDYVDDAQTLERVPVEEFDLVLADPPYSVEDCDHYATRMVKRNVVMSALGKRLHQGAHVVWLDQVLPMFRSDQFEIEAALGMVKSTNHRFRVVTVFGRRQPDEQPDSARDLFEGTQGHARACKGMQGHARACKGMQGHARACFMTSPLDLVVSEDATCQLLPAAVVTASSPILQVFKIGFRNTGHKLSVKKTLRGFGNTTANALISTVPGDARHVIPMRLRQLDFIRLISPRLRHRLPSSFELGNGITPGFGGNMVLNHSVELSDASRTFSGIQKNPSPAVLSATTACCPRSRRASVRPKQPACAGHETSRSKVRAPHRHFLPSAPTARVLQPRWIVRKQREPVIDYSGCAWFAALKILDRMAADMPSDREALKDFLTSMVARVELDPSKLTCRINYDIPVAAGEFVASPRGFELRLPVELALPFTHLRADDDARTKSPRGNRQAARRMRLAGAKPQGHEHHGGSGCGGARVSAQDRLR